MNNSKRGALDEYKKSARTGVEEATPHRLIQMLMDGVLDKVSAAKGFMQQEGADAIAAKGEQISWAISIVDGLKVSLDKSAGGDIAANLESLYVYMSKCLLEANLHNDEKKLDEVIDLMKTIKEGWDQIPQDIIEEHAQKRKAEDKAEAEEAKAKAQEPAAASGSGG